MKPADSLTKIKLTEQSIELAQHGIKMEKIRFGLLELRELLEKATKEDFDKRKSSLLDCVITLLGSTDKGKYEI
jgi:hypothetical protein